MRFRGLRPQVRPSGVRERGSVVSWGGCHMGMQGDFPRLSRQGGCRIRMRKPMGMRA
jgi:hypothetical protein